jgi:REP element-mobilizing transposase RayT
MYTRDPPDTIRKYIALTYSSGIGVPMPRQSRAQVFQPHEVGAYHVFNRTCRRSWLHGLDPLTGIDHSHRRLWFQERMKFLSQHFCLDIIAFAILSNHYHCVIRNRPDLVQKLSDREVAQRWLALTARRACRENPKIRECEIEAITSQTQRVAELRARLSDISWFVRLMCQTVARQCNVEDKCSGRFFEERFKLHRLESESDVLACMAYVDLNPLRAGMVDSLDDPAAQVSIGERLRGLDDQHVDPSSWLAPLELASEVDGQPVEVVNDLSAEEIELRRAALSEKLGCLPMTLEAYCQLLWHLAIESRPELQSSPQLTAAQLRKPVWSSGNAVELDGVTSRMDQWSRQCDASVRGHACQATRKLQPKPRLVAVPPPLPSIIPS